MIHVSRSLLGLLLLLASPTWADPALEARLPVLASVQQVEKLARFEKAFARDLKRLQNTPRITSLDKLLESRSAFTGSLVGKGGATWQGLYRESSRRFSVELGGGCTISGRVQRYENPIASVTKLHELQVEKGGKKLNLMPRVPININFDTSFYYGSRDGRVDWHGPVSRFSILALFHELGHAKDYRGMNEADRAAFARIYDRKTNDETLTPAEKRALVGFERHAWASALKQARALRKELGVDLLAGATRGEVMQTIHGCLKHYYDYEGKRN